MFVSRRAVRPSTSCRCAFAPCICRPLSVVSFSFSSCFWLHLAWAALLQLFNYFLPTFRGDILRENTLWLRQQQQQQDRRRGRAKYRLLSRLAPRETGSSFWTGCEDEDDDERDGNGENTDLIFLEKDHKSTHAGRRRGNLRETLTGATQQIETQRRQCGFTMFS